MQGICIYTYIHTYKTFFILHYLSATLHNDQDGYTAMVTGPEGVSVLVAVKAKPNKDKNSKLNREFFKRFLNVS